ncbi:MAG: hypothetical protein U5M53_03995 [Rhodoferax sp.]|nr:hypothetical protein [Rhodoferax sp.]
MCVNQRHAPRSPSFLADHRLQQAASISSSQASTRWALIVERQRDPAVAHLAEERR